MDGRLDDFSTPALEHAVKANLLAFFRFMRRSPHVVFDEWGGLARWHSAVPYPWFNGALSRRPAAEQDEQAVEQTLAFFRKHGVGIFTWWFESHLALESWRPLLQAHGFHYDANTPGMAVDLEAVRATSASVQLEIVPVKSLEALQAWTEVFIAGYELPRTWETDLYQLMADLGLDWPMQNYIGYLDGKAVATSSLFLAAGVAGIMFVATLPEARRQGIGAALTAAPLHQARQMGYRVGILQSSEMGYKIYLHLGFERVCAVDHFYRSLEIDDNNVNAG